MLVDFKMVIILWYICENFVINKLKEEFLFIDFFEIFLVLIFFYLIKI